MPQFRKICVEQEENKLKDVPNIFLLPKGLMATDTTINPKTKATPIIAESMKTPGSTESSQI